MTKYFEDQVAKAVAIVSRHPEGISRGRVEVAVGRRYVSEALKRGLLQCEHQTKDAFRTALLKAKGAA